MTVMELKANTQMDDDINIRYIKKKRSQFSSIWFRFRKNKVALAALFILAIILIVAISADLIADYDKDAIEQRMTQRLQPPNKEHIFGTDQYGRDLFARVVFGARISLTIGTLTITTSLLFGCIIGSVAGYYGNIVDNLLMRIMDIFLSIPNTLMAICVVAAFGTDLKSLVIALSVANIAKFSRVVRAAILPIKEQEFIEAAKACGANEWRILIRHIIPNAIGPIIVQATLTLATTLLAVSSLSFIGLGVQTPMPEWGTILAENRGEMRYYPYLVIIPGMAIVLSVLSLNLIGDGLRDALDPRLKN